MPSEAWTRPPDHVVACNRRGVTHEPRIGTPHTVCGLDWTLLRLRTDRDPTCAWCRGRLEEADEMVRGG